MVPFKKMTICSIQHFDNIFAVIYYYRKFIFFKVKRTALAIRYFNNNKIYYTFVNGVDCKEYGKLAEVFKYMSRNNIIRFDNYCTEITSHSNEKINLREFINQISNQKNKGIS